MMERWGRILLYKLLVAGLLWAAAPGLASAASPADWLSLCGKCLSPTVVQKSGIGTAHAVAVARITRKGAAAWCDNWQPGSKSCVREQLNSEDAHKTWRASADCIHGRITAVDGVTYRLAGTWARGIGRGRTKWRDSSGHVLGTDNASNGLGISQQWEVLCPGHRTGLVRPQTAHPASPHHTADRYAVGQEIESPVRP